MYYGSQDYFIILTDLSSTFHSIGRGLVDTLRSSWVLIVWLGSFGMIRVMSITDPDPNALHLRK